MGRTLSFAALVLTLAPACDRKPAAVVDAGATPPPVPPPASEAPVVTPAPSASSKEAGATTTCTRDADCVPASCCHATACTHVSRAPACAGIMCTMDVQPGTLDMGKCVCRAGKCAADIAKAPDDLLHPR